MKALLNFKKNQAQIICTFCVLSIIFFNGCARPSEISSPPAEPTKHKVSQNAKVISSGKSPLTLPWADKFFREFLLNSPAIYTIFGDKPMSEHTFCVCTLEEAKESFEPMLKDKTPEERNNFLKRVEDMHANNDFAENWDKWMELKKSSPKSPFLFVKGKSDSPFYYSAYVINVREMTWTLYKNYDVFKKELGHDFDPIQVTLEFEDPESSFWTAVFSNRLLIGIAYGFGERNSYFFSEEMRWDKETGEKARALPIFASIGPKDYDPFEKYFGDGKLEHMQLPMFRSYVVANGEDPVLSHYKSERARIQKFLKGKNLAEEALKKIIPQ